MFGKGGLLKFCGRSRTTVSVHLGLSGDEKMEMMEMIFSKYGKKKYPEEHILSKYSIISMQ